jgi:uncharacterized membrane protein (UPF0127 family)
MGYGVVAIVAGALGLFGCHRAADEIASRGTGSSPVVSSAASAPSNRCMAPTPAEPPPPVPGGPARGCPPDPRPHTLDLVTVQFPEAAAGVARVSSELARTPEDSARGLMFRTAMDEDRGMLFDLGERKVQQFWMRNTCIPLDMIFIDEDGFVVGILENVPTLNEAPRAVPCPSAYVLEVNAGWSRRHGVRAGQRALLPGA